MYFLWSAKSAVNAFCQMDFPPPGLKRATIIYGQKICWKNFLFNYDKTGNLTVLTPKKCHKCGKAQKKCWEMWKVMPTLNICIKVYLECFATILWVAAYIYIYIYFVVDYFSTFPKLKYNTNNTHTHSCRFCWISLERGQRIDWFMGPNWGAGPEFEPGYRWQSKVVAFVIHGKVHRQRHLLGACCNMDFHSWRILPPCPLAASAQLR